MVKSNLTYDVFVSYNREDSRIAAEVAEVLQSYDLRVFTDTEIGAGERMEDALWEAIAESQAFIAIIPEREPSAWTAFEFGAATAWNKPVYAIASNPSSTRLPAPLHRLAVFPPSRIEEIAQDIKRSLKPLTESEKSVLIDEYHRIGLTVDQLLLQPAQLAKLTRNFKRRTGRQIASEELVRMLLRLRKMRALGGTRADKPPRTK
jgi:TIR domain